MGKICGLLTVALALVIMLSSGCGVTGGETRTDSIQQAAMENDFDEVSKHLGNGVDPNETDARGRTALHYAAYTNDEAVAELLIKSGADVNARDNEGHTPLYYAVERDLPQVSEILERHGGEEE